MKKIQLPETGFELSVPEGFHYHDDGLVRSIVAHTAKLERRYGVSLQHPPWYQQALEYTPLVRIYYKWAHDNQRTFLKGLNFTAYPPHDSIDEALDKGAEVNSHTYVLDIFGKEETSFYRGHEETHVLLKLKKLEVLQGALRDIGIQSDTLGKLEGEAICQIGGFYAWQKNHPHDGQIKLKGVMDKTFEQWSRWLRENSGGLITLKKN